MHGPRPHELVPPLLVQHILPPQHHRHVEIRQPRPRTKPLPQPPLQAHSRPRAETRPPPRLLHRTLDPTPLEDKIDPVVRQHPLKRPRRRIKGHRLHHPPRRESRPALHPPRQGVPVHRKRHPLSRQLRRRPLPLRHPPHPRNRPGAARRKTSLHLDHQTRLPRRQPQLVPRLDPTALLTRPQGPRRRQRQTQPRQQTQPRTHPRPPRPNQTRQRRRGQPRPGRLPVQATPPRVRRPRPRHPGQHGPGQRCPMRKASLHHART